jgi:hypothetical protein
MNIQVGSYFYEANNSSTPNGIDSNCPGRITEYPAIRGDGTPDTDRARVEWPGLLGLGQPLPVDKLHLLTGSDAEQAATLFEQMSAADPS